MLSMQPIREPDLLQLLNDGRFEGPLEGYVVMEGTRYHGHALFCRKGEMVEVLDAAIEDAAVLDGAVRACLAAGENRGAALFLVNTACPSLKAWWQAHCPAMETPAPIAALWGRCGS